MPVKKWTAKKASDQDRSSLNAPDGRRSDALTFGRALGQEFRAALHSLHGQLTALSHNHYQRGAAVR